MRARKICTTFSSLLALSLGSGLAHAITNGTPDTEHRNVGAILAEFQAVPGLVVFVCSGVLVAPSVFLTANHCVSSAEAIAPSVDRIWVTFDDDASQPTTLIPAGALHVLSANRGIGRRTDLGVIELSTPVTVWNGVPLAPAVLPEEGLLDAQSADGGLIGTTFLSVGYGDDVEMPPPVSSWDGLRRRVESDYLGLTPLYLRLFQNQQASEGGGTCEGDSGSPKFIPGTNKIVAISTLADRLCIAQSSSIRLDIPATREFLGEFVPLP